MNNLFESLEILRYAFAFVGILYLLFGMKFHFLFIQINGFIIGGFLGALIGQLFFETGVLLISIIGFIVFGGLGASIALFLNLFGVFLSGFVVGSISGGIAYFIFFDSDPSAGIFIIFGIIGGFVMLTLYRTWLIGLTSLIGSFFLGTGLLLHPAWWILFFLIGIGFQSYIYKSSSDDNFNNQISPSTRPKTNIKPTSYSYLTSEQYPSSKDGLILDKNLGHNQNGLTKSYTSNISANANSTSDPLASPLDILKTRLQNGEISKDEYLIIEKRLMDL